MGVARVFRGYCTFEDVVGFRAYVISKPITLGLFVGRGRS